MVDGFGRRVRLGHHHKRDYIVSSLQRIHKLMILLIRQIHPLLILHLDIPRTLSNLSLLRILPNIPPPDKPKQQHTNPSTHNNRDLRRHVLRRILRLERLRSDNIPNAVPDQVQRGHRRLLRVPGHVGRDQRQERYEARWRGVCQVVAQEAADVVGHG